MIIQLYIGGLFTTEEFLKEIIILLIGCTITGIPYTINYIKRKYKEDKVPNIIRYNNDNFARETIKYRMKNIIMNLKKRYNILDYSEFTDSKFKLDIFNSDLFSQYNNELFKSWIKTLEKFEKGKISDFFINAPFIDIEHYFYYSILYQVRSHQETNKNNIIDPYKVDKIISMKNDYFKNPDVHKSKIKELLDLGLKIKYCIGDQEQERNICELLKLNLSANSTDLSQLFWEQFSNVSPVIDDTQKFWDNYVSDLHNVTRINILTDNFGVEFLADIIMGYYFILKKGKNTKIEVIYNVNELPIFVSDVSHNDETLLFDTLNEFVKDNKYYKELLNDIQSLITENKLLFKPDFFWNMPVYYNTIVKPEYKKAGYLSEIKNIFCGTDLLIVKGDLNYRRLVGDRNYNPQKDIKNCINYIKCPLLIIRSFKSNVTLLGKNYKEFIKNKRIEQDWQSNGKYGIIQYIDNIKS